MSLQHRLMALTIPGYLGDENSDLDRGEYIDHPWYLPSEPSLPSRTSLPTPLLPACRSGQRLIICRRLLSIKSTIAQLWNRGLRLERYVVCEVARIIVSTSTTCAIESRS